MTGLVLAGIGAACTLAAMVVSEIRACVHPSAPVARVLPPGTRATGHQPKHPS